jgi:hypothetical protein
MSHDEHAEDFPITQSNSCAMLWCKIHLMLNFMAPVLVNISRFYFLLNIGTCSKAPWSFIFVLWWMMYNLVWYHAKRWHALHHTFTPKPPLVVCGISWHIYDWRFLFYYPVALVVYLAGWVWLVVYHRIHRHFMTLGSFLPRCYGNVSQVRHMCYAW